MENTEHSPPSPPHSSSFALKAYPQHICPPAFQWSSCHLIRISIHSTLYTRLVQIRVPILQPRSQYQDECLSVCTGCASCFAAGERHFAKRAYMTAYLPRYTWRSLPSRISRSSFISSWSAGEHSSSLDSPSFWPTQWITLKKLSSLTDLSSTSGQSTGRF